MSQAHTSWQKKSDLVLEKVKVSEQKCIANETTIDTQRQNIAQLEVITFGN